MTNPSRPAEDASCFVCGAENAKGLKLSFRRDGNVIRSSFVPGAGEQGFDGITHGGVLAAVLDDAMAHCLYQRGIRAFTGRIEVRFRQPVAIGTRLEIYAQLVQERGAFAIAKAWAAAADGELVAEAKSTLIRQPDEPSRSTET